MEHRPQEPRRIWWARPRKLCALERPGGGGRSHRSERRAAEIAYLTERGVRLVISTMTTRHNLAAYAAAGIEWHHRPVGSAAEWATAFEELLDLLDRRLRAAGAVAVHGNSHTDFVAAVAAGHLDAARGVDPVLGLARAAQAGLTISADSCALLGVPIGDVREAIEDIATQRTRAARRGQAVRRAA
jgi:hypothetical protein